MGVGRYCVVLRHNPSGETIRIEEDGHDSSMDVLEFLWEEGNYSCDCNRHLFWERAHGREPPDEPPFPCDDGVVRVYDLVSEPTVVP